MKPIGVLLTNLGTPDAATPLAVKKYLREFLSDSRVIEIPSLIWQPILQGIILQVRPKKSAALYKKIWLDEGSPLLVYSERLAKNLQDYLTENSSQTFKVKLAMRYGNPSIAKALAEFQQQQIEKILILPLYPQYAAATTASTFDAIAHYYKKQRYIPELQFINGYAVEEKYISAITNSIKQHWQQNSQRFLLFSFHGLPKRCVDLGDPYQQQCLASAKLIAEQLQLNSDQWQAVFQSRFGKAEWLQPYCDVTLKELPQRGIKKIDVVCPGFSVDCLETLEEMAIQNREIFLQAGGEEYRYISALNDSADHVKLITSLLGF